MSAPASPVVLLLSGPNLNLLGSREPEVYGTATLADHEATARVVAEAHGLVLEHQQSNHEGDLIDAIHGARGEGCDRLSFQPFGMGPVVGVVEGDQGPLGGGDAEVARAGCAQGPGTLH